MKNDMSVIVSMLCEKTPKVMNLIQESLDIFIALRGSSVEEIMNHFILWAMNRELKPVIQAGQEQPPWIIGSRTCPGKEIVELAHDSKA
ncbi:hypothetical protein ACG0U9_09830, partial [Klebsiella pneumoniae]